MERTISLTTGFAVLVYRGKEEYASMFVKSISEAKEEVKHFCKNGLTCNIVKAEEETRDYGCYKKNYLWVK